MVSLSLLEKRGVSAKHWKEIFTRDENRQPTFDVPTEPSYGTEEKGKKKKKAFTGLNALRSRIRSRIQGGRDWNLSNFRTYHAVDLAFDVPLKKAVTPTMIHGLMDRMEGSMETIKSTLSSWGMNLDDVVTEVMDNKVDGKSVYKVSAPSFFQLFVPLVKAYLTIRQAKIMNDMLQTPFFEYTPAYESAKTRLQCDVITSRVEVMAEQFDYYSVLKQCVFQMLHYGRSLQFPVEEWYSEVQEVENEDDAEQSNGKPVVDKNDRYTKVVKEGMRYHMAHPSRHFFDQAHNPSTFNTDTGCDHGGYWRAFRCKDVMNNPAFFNTDKIALGNYKWDVGWNSFFSTVYPCTMAWPTVGYSSNDRESKMMDGFYTEDMGDKAVCITEYFEKLTPADYDLGDYHYPIWCRFVVAGDDTIIYAAPLPYAPIIYYAYDDDQARSQNASLSLEIVPFQDHFSQLMSQYVLCIKQNLSNVTFVDENMVDAENIRTLRGLKERLYRFRNFIMFKGPKWRVEQKSPESAFFSHTFPQLDTNGIVQAMKMILDIMERVLQMSSQELGAAASHEQSKYEVSKISEHTSTRLTYTATPVHLGRQAMKRQLYAGLMGYGEEEFWAEIPFDRAIDSKMLKEIGFTYKEDEHPAHPNGKKRTVRAKKSAIMIERFAAARQNEESEKNAELAMALLNSIDRLMAGPAGPAIGVDQALELINLAGRAAGWPRDFKLKNMTPEQSPEEKAAAIREQLSGFITEIENKILGEVKQGLAPMLEHQKQLEEAVGRITEILNAAGQAQQQPQLGMPQPQMEPAGTPIPNGQPMPGAMAAPMRY